MANQQCDMAFVPDNPMCFGLHHLRTLLHPQFEDSMIFKQCSKMTNLDVNVGSPWLGKLIQVPILGKQASHLIYIHIYIYTYIYIYIHIYIYVYHIGVKSLGGPINGFGNTQSWQHAWVWMCFNKIIWVVFNALVG